jgi:hypothetical protein
VNIFDEMTAGNWEVGVALERARFVAGEPIVVSVAARALQANEAIALAPGQSDPPLLEIRRDGGAPERVALRGAEGGRQRRPTKLVEAGDTIEGSFDLAEAVQPTPGSYEAVLELSDRSRSEPFQFVVEPARGLVWTVAPSDPTGAFRRVFARLEERSPEPRIVLTRPRRRERETLELGVAPRDARLAVSVPSPDVPDARQWVIFLAGRSLVRSFVDSEPYVHRFEPVELPADATELVAALGGAAVAPSPPPRPESEPDGRARVFDEEPWPELHVLLVARPRGAPSRLFAVTIAPAVGAVPKISTRDLPGPFLGGAAVPLSGANRLALAAVTSGKSDVSLVALAWNAAGLGAPFVLVRSPGRFQSMDAVVLPEGAGTRAAILAIERREKEKDEALFVREARVDASGVVQERPPRLVVSGDRLRELTGLRIRLAGEDGTYVLASRTSDGRALVLAPETDEPMETAVPKGATWDLELDGGSLAAIFLDPERGVVSEPIKEH